MIRVLIVDDSPSVCRVLRLYLDSAEDVEVVAVAHGGKHALKLARSLKPDVITLDQEMPKMGGIETLHEIMAKTPTPVVMISGVSHKAAQLTMQALNMGAVDFIFKYTPGEAIDADALRRDIVAKVRAAAQVKVIRNLFQPQASVTIPLPESNGITGSVRQHNGYVVIVGASTGGPLALRAWLSGLPTDFDHPIVIVQHIPASFVPILAQQLTKQVGNRRVVEAQHNSQLQVGMAYIAPGDQHVLFRPNGTIHLQRGPRINGHRPSIDVAMQSAAQQFGGRAAGVLLTGMGEDGAAGMVAIKAKGGPTYAQDETTSVVFGMPQRAIERGAASVVGPPSLLAERLDQFQRTNWLRPRARVTS